ncbi:MAG: hypothetical protein Q4D53_03750 [Leptotrichiaceae bacterium]|nr:hypothetical protein [Leptotrichiaceae bacterium]
MNKKTRIMTDNNNADNRSLLDIKLPPRVFKERVKQADKIIRADDNVKRRINEKPKVRNKGNIEGRVRELSQKDKLTSSELKELEKLSKRIIREEYSKVEMEKNYERIREISQKQYDYLKNFSEHGNIELKDYTIEIIQDVKNGKYLVYEKLGKPKEKAEELYNNTVNNAEKRLSYLLGRDRLSLIEIREREELKKLLQEGNIEKIEEKYGDKSGKSKIETVDKEEKSLEILAEKISKMNFRI